LALGAANGGATGNANGGALLGLFVNMMTDLLLPGRVGQQKKHNKGQIMQHISISQKGERGQQLRPDDSARWQARGAGLAPSLARWVRGAHTSPSSSHQASESCDAGRPVANGRETCLIHRFRKVFSGMISE
jgi:hypothetical protein